MKEIIVKNQKFSLPEWVNWVAQDENGVWWGFEVEPLQFDKGWYENELGRNVEIISEGRRNDEWRTTLMGVD